MDRRRLIIYYLILLGITILGGWLRLYRLHQAPPSVNWDEASYGYNAYSLWKTGRDEYGTPLPITIRSFDDYKPPVYAYLTAPVVGLFGLNEFTSRLTSAVFGTLAVIVSYLLVVRLTRHRPLGLATAAVVATSPALVHYSRLAFEAVPALTFLLISWWYLGTGRTRPQSYVPALLFAALSYFSYNSHKVYFPLTALYIAWQLRGSIRRRFRLILALGAVCLPVLYSVVFSPSLARFSQTSVFPLFRESNSVYVFSGELVNRYLAYFSPANIFARGTNEPNQKVHNFAVFFPFLFLFFLIGAGVLLRRFRRWGFWLFLWLTAPLPAAITWSWFTPVRVLPHWWLTGFVIAVGLITVWSRIRGSLVRLVGAAAVSGWWILNIIWLAVFLLWSMPYTDSGLWQWGFRETIRTIGPDLGSYSRVVWESPHAQPHIFVLFYSQYDPAAYQSELPQEIKQPGARNNWDFGKFEFRKIYWPRDRGSSPDTLFVGGVYSLPQQDISPPWKIVEDILDPAGYTSFRIVSRAL